MPLANGKFDEEKKIKKYIETHLIERIKREKLKLDLLRVLYNSIKFVYIILVLI